MSDDLQLEPDAADVVQAEEEPYDVPVVRVEVCGPVRSQALPTKSAGARSRLVADTASTQLLRSDPYRARATLVSADQPFYFATTQAETDRGNAARWPQNVPLEVRATDELWVRSATAAQSTTVSVYQERWALS